MLRPLCLQAIFLYWDGQASAHYLFFFLLSMKKAQIVLFLRSIFIYFLNLDLDNVMH